MSHVYFCNGIYIYYCKSVLNYDRVLARMSVDKGLLLLFWMKTKFCGFNWMSGMQRAKRRPDA